MGRLSEQRPDCTARPGTPLTCDLQLVIPFPGPVSQSEVTADAPVAERSAGRAADAERPLLSCFSGRWLYCSRGWRDIAGSSAAATPLLCPRCCCCCCLHHPVVHQRLLFTSMSQVRLLFPTPVDRPLVPSSTRLLFSSPSPDPCSAFPQPDREGGRLETALSRRKGGWRDRGILKLSSLFINIFCNHVTTGQN